MCNRLLLPLILLLLFPTLKAQVSWSGVDYDGQPWVKNISLPYTITNGLTGRHLAVWASHGRYYCEEKQQWKWQRPALFGTNEDLFTQTIVVPYLIPMLEDAGAVVFTPRERDWQRHEVIVDNDTPQAQGRYEENDSRQAWFKAPSAGFAAHQECYHDGENPFEAGTARMTETTNSKNKHATICYQPDLPATGRYAVYVSYQTVPSSIDDAHYTVCHQGQKTDFLVNQQMGGSTWVYLGTFEFDKGCSDANCVMLSNQSQQHGMVTADAVRFGGGMGNIERGGNVSHMPRCLEGARYYAQWAGMPYEIYSQRMGSDDYADDINVRSLMTNLLCGGSPYAPDSIGRKVPIETCLAVHSDAGYTPTGEGIYGTLSICTTHHGDSLLASGRSREMSRDLANDLLLNTFGDLQEQYGTWFMRDIYDRNYSETRRPVMPSAIIETLSHQNFGDMRYGHDPNFKFTLARSLYRTLLKYTAHKHQTNYAATPLPPQNFRVEIDQATGEAILTWTPVADQLDETAVPTGYVLYIAHEQQGFDNGTFVPSNCCSVKLRPGTLYHFQVRAVNTGGRSFPTQVLSARYQPEAHYTVLIVDGFHRLSSPAINGQGFRLDEDPGVSYGRTAGWLGFQKVFDINKIGIEDSTGLGFTGNEFEGRFIAGNDFNYVRTHADAIAPAKQYNIASCSSESIGFLNIDHYTIVDVLLGLERDDGHSLVAYKALPAQLQQALANYARHGGRLLVSGAYIGTDMKLPYERHFLSDVLKCSFDGESRCIDGKVHGMGLDFDYQHELNEQHYAATHTDILTPAGNEAFCAMAYSNNASAAVAYAGDDYRSFVMGFPLECIISDYHRRAIMQGILKFLQPQNEQQ